MSGGKAFHTLCDTDTSSPRFSVLNIFIALLGFPSLHILLARRSVAQRKYLKTPRPVSLPLPLPVPSS